MPYLLGPDMQTYVNLPHKIQNPNPSPTGTRFGFVLCGEPSGIRTPDTLLKRQVLCRLS